mgnify:CR=1 FL=1
MKTTYYRMLAIDEIWRATTKQAKKKLNGLAERMPDIMQAISPREARELIATGKKYRKIQNIM